MRVKNKKDLNVVLLVGCILTGYILWLLLRPVEIIAVHHRENSFTSVLTSYFPLTDKGKIDWWLKNKDLLKEKYNIPRVNNDGLFEIIFWDFGKGYKETDGYDRLCFDDMKTPLNCIEKDKVFTVWNDKNKHIFLGVHDGFYRIQENGKLLKNKYK